MTIIEVRGRINEHGQLEIELPEGLPPGEVRVLIERAEGEDLPPLTEAEIDELLRTHPMTGAAIVAAGLTGGWRDLGISSGETWVEAQRTRRKDRWAW
jgi:hypothetical protein